MNINNEYNKTEKEIELIKQIISSSKCKIVFKEDFSNFHIVIPPNLEDHQKQIRNLLIYDWCSECDMTDNIVIIKIDQLSDIGFKPIIEVKKNGNRLDATITMMQKLNDLNKF